MGHTGHTDASLALEVYAKVMERQRDTGSGWMPFSLAGLSIAAGQGFEPQLPDPESGVLPLDDPATGRRPV
jgi:hypothetical protein